MHAVILGFGGLPVIWMGDELGLLNDPDWAAEPGHSADNRWAHRPRMSWPPTDHFGVGDLLKRLIAARRRLPQLHAATPTEVLTPWDPGVFLLLRRHPVGPMLGAYNVTAEPRQLPVQLLREHGLTGEPFEHIRAASLPAVDGVLVLQPYQPLWLTDGSARA